MPSFDTMEEGNMLWIEPAAIPERRWKWRLLMATTPMPFIGRKPLTTEAAIAMNYPEGFVRELPTVLGWRCKLGEHAMSPPRPYLPVRIQMDMWLGISKMRAKLDGRTDAKRYPKKVLQISTSIKWLAFQSSCLATSNEHTLCSAIPK